MNSFKESVNSISFSMDSEYMVTGSSDKTNNLIQIQSKKVIHKFDSIHTGQ